MSNILIVTIILGLLAAVRFAIAVATGDRSARWAVVPVAWAAFAIGCMGASGCLATEDAQQGDAGEAVDVLDALPPDTGPDAQPPRPDAPPPKLLNVTIYIGPDAPDSYVAIGFWVTCPPGAPDGPHHGRIEHFFSDGLTFHSDVFTWTCEFNARTVAIFNVPCGRQVFGRATIDNPTGGEAVETTTTMPTIGCAP